MTLPAVGGWRRSATKGEKHATFPNYVISISQREQIVAPMYRIENDSANPISTGWVVFCLVQAACRGSGQVYASESSFEAG